MVLVEGGMGDSTVAGFQLFLESGNIGTSQSFKFSNDL